MAKLPGDLYRFQAHDSEGTPDKESEVLMHCPAARTIDLKVGAQVVLLRKVESLDGLVNGSRGVVTGFVASHKTGRIKGRMAQWYDEHPLLPVVKFTSNQAEIIVPPIEWEVWSSEKK